MRQSTAQLALFSTDGAPALRLIHAPVVPPLSPAALQVAREQAAYDRAIALGVPTELAFLERFYLGAEFRQWGRRLWDTSFNHGWDLVLAIGCHGGTGAGNDAGASADKWLSAAEKAGWIKSTGCRPSPQQRFTGVGGMTGGLRGNALSPYPSTHGWEPVRSAAVFYAWLLNGEERA